MCRLRCHGPISPQASRKQREATGTVAVAGGRQARTKITVNMELFSRRDTVPQSTIVGDPMEHARRQCCYAAHNLTIGPSWEITDW